MSKTLLIFPNQLYLDALDSGFESIQIWTHPLFFTQLPFHRQKVALHLASVEEFAKKARTFGLSVTISEDISHLRGQAVTAYEPSDDYLSRDLESEFPGHRRIKNPGFLLSESEAIQDFSSRKPYRMQTFYEKQRRRWNVLLEPDGSPTGGRWSFDTENRKRVPKGLVMPPAYPLEKPFIDLGRYEANLWGDNLPLQYASTHEGASAILKSFISQRLTAFGPYEDAILAEEDELFHSVLTPYLNTGLLTPSQVLDEVVQASQAANIPLASTEGFIRQLIGWREYMRAAYLVIGRPQRVKNFFGFTNKVPLPFWEATTGLEPADNTIRRLQRRGYCHHIERLMVLGNLMLLTECQPTSVYEWFMSTFIDSYDWVMVPNVYGMSQFSDGGWMVTKPYLSGSAYIKKMSNYPDGEWCKVWDGLYWRFISRYRNVFEANPRLSMMPRMWDKMDRTKQLSHLSRAEGYLSQLHTSG